MRKILLLLIIALILGSCGPQKLHTDPIKFELSMSHDQTIDEVWIEVLEYMSLGREELININFDQRSRVMTVQISEASPYEYEPTPRINMMLFFDETNVKIKGDYTLNNRTTKHSTNKLHKTQKNYILEMLSGMSNIISHKELHQIDGSLNVLIK